MQAIIQLTDKAEDQSIDIAVGLDSQDLNLASPAHIVAVWIVNNFSYIVEKAGNERSKLIAAVAAEQLERGNNGEPGAENAAQNTRQLEDVNGRRLSTDTSQERGVDHVGSETESGVPPAGLAN